jgi:hypothetical protein
MDTTTLALRRFTAATGEFVPFLQRKAAAGRAARGH